MKKKKSGLRPNAHQLDEGRERRIHMQKIWKIMKGLQSQYTKQQSFNGVLKKAGKNTWITIWETGKYPFGSFFSQHDHLYNKCVYNEERKVNKHNLEFEAQKNLMKLKKYPKKWKVTVWCANSYNKATAPYCFDEPDVNWDSYLHFLNK